MVAQSREGNHGLGLGLGRTCALCLPRRDDERETQISQEPRAVKCEPRVELLAESALKVVAEGPESLHDGQVGSQVDGGGDTRVERDGDGCAGPETHDRAARRAARALPAGISRVQARNFRSSEKYP